MSTSTITHLPKSTVQLEINIPWQEIQSSYEEILKNVCKEQKLPFIELMSKFMDNNFKALLTDGLHPNTEGHRIMYEEVKKYLLENSLI